MANVNKVMFIGRLTRDPEIRTFASGGKVASFGFAVTNRKKDVATGQWVDDPMFIDAKVFNRGEFGKQADLVEQSLHKGNQVFLEGHLVLESWEDKQTGQKRSKHVVVVDNFQFLEPRAEGAGTGSTGGQSRFQPRPAAPARNTAPTFSNDFGDEGSDFGGSQAGPPDEEIPF